MGLPGFEPGSSDSESEVLTNYTTGPYNFTSKKICVDRESNPDLVLGRHEF